MIFPYHVIISVLKDYHTYTSLKYCHILKRSRAPAPHGWTQVLPLYNALVNATTLDAISWRHSTAYCFVLDV